MDTTMITTATSCGPDKMPFTLNVDLTGSTREQRNLRIMEAVRITVHRKVNAMTHEQREQYRGKTLTVGIDGNPVETPKDRADKWIENGVNPTIATILANDPDKLADVLNSVDVDKLDKKAA